MSASADPCRSLAAVTGRVRGRSDVGHRPSTAHLRPRPVRSGRWTHPRRVGDGEYQSPRPGSARHDGALEGRLRPRSTVAAGRLERRPDRGQKHAAGRRHYMAGGSSNTGGICNSPVHPSVLPSFRPSVLLVLPSLRPSVLPSFRPSVSLSSLIKARTLSMSVSVFSLSDPSVSKVHVKGKRSVFSVTRVHSEIRERVRSVRKLRIPSTCRSVTISPSHDRLMIRRQVPSFSIPSCPSFLPRRLLLLPPSLPLVFPRLNVPVVNGLPDLEMWIPYPKRLSSLNSREETSDLNLKSNDSAAVQFSSLNVRVL